MISRSKVGVEPDVATLQMPNLGPRLWIDTNTERLMFSSIDMAGINAVDEHGGEDHDSIPLSSDGTTLSPDKDAQAEAESRAEDIAAALNHGRQEGHAAASIEYEERLVEERKRILKCCGDFHRAREEYFAAIEHEVVKLALAVAKRVLHREVQAEPLVLRGAVSAALVTIADESGTILRVPAREVKSWRELLQKNQSFDIEVRGEDQLAPGECILDTRLGRVELGVDTQMEEIEKSFSDLIQQRPV